jgi:hypothetical protein
MMFCSRRAKLVVMSFALASVPAAAQESLVELTHRGPELRGAIGAAGLIVESMDISIGLKNSAIKYRISNPTAASISTTLSMPLPELVFSDPDANWSIPAADPVNYVGLTVTLNQKPASLSFTQAVYLGEKDVSATLRRVDVSPIPVGAFQNQLAALTAEARARLARDGLIAEAGTNQVGNPIYFPRWSVRTTASRKLEFAPGQNVAVEFKFQTSVGISRDSVLREPLRSEKSLEREVERRRVDYCLDRSFFGGVDKIVSTAAAQLARPPDQVGPQQSTGDRENASGSSPPTEPLRMIDVTEPAARIFPQANVANLQEMRIAFDFGANAPDTTVRQFRLAVDKGKATRVVSVCLNNLRKISATGFEMRAADYRPAGLLKILLVGAKD